MSVTFARRSGAAVAALAAGLIGAPVAAADDTARTGPDVSVTITDLGRGARATAITDSGVVIGSITADDGSRAFRWEDGVLTYLEHLGGSYSVAYDVNERGQVVGSSNTDGPESHAVLWEPDGTVVDLGPDGASSEATGINRFGDVAGTLIPPGGEVRAVVWRDGVMTDVGDLGGGWSNAAARPSINDLGQVTGTSVDTGGRELAFRWQDGVMTALAPPPGAPEESSTVSRGINRRGDVFGSTDAGYTAVVWDVERGPMRVPGLGGEYVAISALSDRGHVVGYAQTPDGAAHAFLAQGGATVDLGTLGGRHSEATAVNRHGQVVGDSGVGPDPYALHAVLWDDGVTVDLGTLDGGSISIATDINRRGQIVGWSLDADGVEHAVMWTVGR